MNTEIFNSFQKAVNNPENYENNIPNWNFVEADVFLDLNSKYSSNILVTAITQLIDEYLK